MALAISNLPNEFKCNMKWSNCSKGLIPGQKVVFSVNNRYFGIIDDLTAIPGIGEWDMANRLFSFFIMATEGTASMDAGLITVDQW